MFNRKRRAESLARHVMEKRLKESEAQTEISRKELVEARRLAAILNGIRMENHIVNDLRKVFGGN